MKPGNDAGVGAGTDSARSLAALLARLWALALEPTFEVERRRALSRALRPYYEYEARFGFTPLSEEVALAHLYVFADYLPADGQPSLVEQVRDTITAHVPDEERIWLDPLRHSHMDVLEVVALPEGGQMELRSLGSGKTYRVEAGELAGRCRPGQVVLTRVVCLGDRAVIPGAAIVLSSKVGRALFNGIDEWRRTMEAEAGSFELGEWEEFAKSYGHVFLWRFAQVRLEALLRAEMNVRYRTLSGQPFLYALALYEHDGSSWIRESFSNLEGWTPASDPAAPASSSSLVQTESVAGHSAVVARLTLTPTQLFVECESGARLDRVKHQLAAVFGFALHFRGESSQVPPHDPPEANLEEDEPAPQIVLVSPEVEQELLEAFLESVYLEWADRASPALHGQTPRHAAHTAEGRAKVAALIESLEREDLAARRTGKVGYDYNRLRAQVGLEGKGDGGARGKGQGEE